MLGALLPVVGLAAVPAARAATAFTFSPPQTSPLQASANYTGASNGTLSTQPIVPGAVFDRFIQVWLENQDFSTVSSTVRCLADRSAPIALYLSVVLTSILTAHVPKAGRAGYPPRLLLRSHPPLGAQLRRYRQRRFLRLGQR